MLIPELLGAKPSPQGAQPFLLSALVCLQGTTIAWSTALVVERSSIEATAWSGDVMVGRTGTCLPMKAPKIGLSVSRMGQLIWRRCGPNVPPLRLTPPSVMSAHRAERTSEAERHLGDSSA